MESMVAVRVDTTAVTAAIAELQFEEANLVALVHAGAVFLQGQTPRATHR
jgi:hypothetical protein